MIATYRIQLNPDFDFGRVEELLPYFEKLGISHLYLSPITEARPGSPHGYDVTNHNAVRADLGGRAGFERLVAKARAHGLGVIIDFVPNHAGVGPLNEYWQDLLAYGPYSPYATFFDIDWNPLKPELRDKILLPFLGGTYGEVFDNGEIGLTYEPGQFYCTYFDHRFALRPATYALLLETILQDHERTEAYWDLKDLVEAYRGLTPENRQKAETLRPRLVSLGERIDLDRLAGSLERGSLHDLLERQYWRLSYWKTAGQEINYRRFFDINGLVALRMEDDQVFWDTHRLLGELLVLDGLDGVRIDHIDGLFDPHKYLRSLRDLGGKQIWVEKILAPGETLPDEWPVEGTTGYEFLNDVLGLFVDPAGRLALERTYRRFDPNSDTFERVVYRSKAAVMNSTLASELFRLAYELDRISESDYHTRDFTLDGLRAALMETTAALDRYRTYLPYDADTAREVTLRVVHLAQQRNPATDPSVYEFIMSVILGDVRDDLLPVQRAWVGRFQQYTAPVAAKGVEDTAFYRFLLLSALNEVGGDPDRFGQSIQAFHSHARFRAIRYPRNLLCTATHDHKRGEDTRMRLAVLSELPEEWDEIVNALTALAEPHRSEQGPSRADQYLYFQTLVALWHGSDHRTLAERLWNYMLKASRERKIRTSWIHQNESYEQALERFVRRMTEDKRVIKAVAPFSERIARHGYHNSIGQTVIKLTTPGIPDIYQGAELLDLTLVDPDNRRPVDYELLARLHEETQQADADSFRSWLDGCDPRGKMYVIGRLLRLRRRHEGILSGGYVPLNAEGAESDRLIGFARIDEESGRAILVIVTRFSAGGRDLSSVTVDLSPLELHGSYTDVLSRRTIEPDTTLRLSDLPFGWAVLSPD